MSDVVRLGQAATRLGLCAATVRTLIKSGDLGAVKLGRRWLGIEVAELERFIQSRRHGADRNPAEAA